MSRRSATRASSIPRWRSPRTERCSRASFDGLSITHGDSCSWAFASPELTSKFVIDVSTEKQTPAASVALSSDGHGNNQFTTILWGSPDNGVTWAKVGNALPLDFLGLTLDVAPSDPSRLIASGLAAVRDGKYLGVVERSIDRGQTWERSFIPASDAGTGPYLAAIDPVMPERIYLRIDGAPGRLLASSNGGETWDEIFVGQGSLKGFALSPDGATLLVGGDKDGVWRAATATLDFEKVSSVAVECLTWSGAEVFACASEFIDGFTIGVSLDEGTTFTALHHLPCLRGPLACAPGSSVDAVCVGAWPSIATTLDVASCAQGQGGGGASSSSSGGGPPPAPETDDGGGCGCRVVPAGDRAAAGLGLCFVALALRARRRRR